MQKKVFISLVTILVLGVFVSSAFAWRSVRTGKHNFEKAWLAYANLQDAKAMSYFEQSASAFAEALAVDPPSKTARYVSNLTMAGISFYYAGRYDECIENMTLAHRKEKRIWEANLFIGLSHGRLGNKANAIEFLNLYLQSMPSQRNLSDTVIKQLAALDAGETTLAEALNEVDKATQLQFIHNISLNFTPRSSNPSTERCSGAYWWRKNSSPCFPTGYGLNSM